MSCLIKVNSKTIKLTVHTSCYFVLDLLCVNWKSVRQKQRPWWNSAQNRFCWRRKFFLKNTDRFLQSINWPVWDRFNWFNLKLKTCIVVARVSIINKLVKNDENDASSLHINNLQRRWTLSSSVVSIGRLTAFYVVLVPLFSFGNHLYLAKKSPRKKEKITFGLIHSNIVIRSVKKKNTFGPKNF